MVQLGERCQVLPAFIANINNALTNRTQVGKVVYVHPKGRYAVLEFEGVYGNPREGYRMDELTPDKLVIRKRGKRK